MHVFCGCRRSVRHNWSTRAYNFKPYTGNRSSQIRGLLCSRTKRTRRHRRVGKPNSLTRASLCSRTSTEAKGSHFVTQRLSMISHGICADFKEGQAFASLSPGTYTAPEPISYRLECTVPSSSRPGHKSDSVCIRRPMREDVCEDTAMSFARGQWCMKNSLVAISLHWRCF